MVKEYLIDTLSASTEGKIVDWIGSLYTSSLEDVNVITAVASSLCALFAVFYIGNIIWKSWCQGNSINIYACFRPFVIGFICFNFTSFVGFLDTVANAVVEPTQTLTGVAAKKCKIAVNSYEEKIKNQELKGGDAVEVEGEVVSPSLITEAIESAFQDLLLAIITLVCFIAMVCVLIFNIVVKIILVYFGPIVFALAITPMFSGLIGSWVARFLNCSLTIAVINVVNYVLLNFYTEIIKLQESEIQGQGVTASLQSIDSARCGNDLLLLVGVMGIIMYACIPSISGMIIESSGSSALTHEGSQNAKKPVNKGLAKVAKVAITKV